MNYNLFQFLLNINMTGLKNLVVQIHPKDQSFMNLTLLWENTGYVEPGIQSSKYYHGIVKKRLNTKKYSCANYYVKHYQCAQLVQANYLELTSFNTKRCSKNPSIQ